MNDLEKYLKQLEESMAEADKKRQEEHEKWAAENPKQTSCDHGVAFDKNKADKILAKPRPKTSDPALDFIMGHPGHKEIRKRWPRLDGECPKGCGFKGIAYASEDHYFYGDW